MRILIASVILLFVGCSPKCLTAWSKDEMIIDVLMLRNQGWESITVDTLKTGTYHIYYK